MHSRRQAAGIVASWGHAWARLVLLLLLPLLLPAAGQAQPTQPPLLRFCAEDENSYPWMLKDRPGLNQIMMSLLARQIGQPIQIERQPWRRCLLSLQAGQVDGAFKASYSAERLAYGRYPLRADGQLDTQRQMLDESYHLYRRKSSRVQWDGERLRYLSAPVGAQTGFSIVAQLRSMGLVVDEGSRVAEAILVKLLRGRIDAAALQTQQGDHALRSDPALGAAIERIGPQLVSKPYYLMLSHQLLARDPALAERIWDGVVAVRESAEYRAAQDSFR